MSNHVSAKAFIANGFLELGLEHLRMYIRSPFKRIGGLQPEIAVAFFLTGKKRYVNNFAMLDIN